MLSNFWRCLVFFNKSDQSLKFSRQVICFTCHSEDNCDFHLMLSLMCLSIYFQKIVNIQNQIHEAALSHGISLNHFSSW